MQAFTQHTGIVAALDRANVDTDQIIPKQFLKRIERSGFGPFLFFDWRYDANGNPNPDFELNLPRNAHASILIARRNFGSGSSREHAVWAIDNYGIRAVIAPSFADIFHSNCFKNGTLPIKLTEDQVQQLFDRHQQNVPYTLTIDLEAGTIRDDQGLCFEFSIEPFRKHCMLHGLDDIALTLSNADKIDAYEKARGIA